MNTLSKDNFFNKYALVIISFFLFALNLIIKIIYIDSRDIANDEPFTIYWAQASLNEIIQMLSSENNPPFHFFLMHFWIKLFGISPLSVRFLSMLFSVLIPVVIFLFGNKYFNRFIGFAAALIFTFTTMHVFFSHEARVYTMFALLTAVSLFILIEITEKPTRKILYFYLFISNLILIYSHYFGFFILFIEAVTLFVSKNRMKILKPMFFMMLALGLSYLPLIFVFLTRLTTSTSHGTWVAPPQLGQVYGFLNLFINDRLNMLVFILLALLGFGVTFFNKKIKALIEQIKNEKVFIVALWFLIPYLLMFFISFKVPMFVDRYILYTTIPFYILLAIIINAVFEKNIFKYIAISVFVLSLAFTFELNPDNFRRMKELTSLIKKLKTEQSVVLIAPDYSDLGFTYHYNIDYFKDYKNYSTHLKKENIFAVNSKDQAKSIIDSNHECIYIQAGSEFQDPDNAIYNYLASHYKKVQHHKIFQIYLVHKFSE